MSKSKKNLKTYIICTSPRGNNIANYFFALAQGLFEDGNNVILVLDKKSSQNYEDLKFPILTWPSYRPTRFKDFIFFFKLCKKYKPNVILGQFGSTNIVLIVGFLLGVKNRLVYWHTMFNQIAFDSTTSKIKDSFLVLRKKYIIKLFSTLVLTNSNATKLDLIKNFNLKNEILISPFLIKDAYIDSKLDKEGRNFSVVIVGRLHKSKGHESLLNLMPSVIKLYPNLLIKIIGDGPERRVLEKQTRILGITKNVKFMGNLSLSEVYKGLEESYIHISASLEEAFGLVNVEALAAGTPIMAQKVGGICDILKHGKNGQFYNLEVEKTFIDALSLILNDWCTYSVCARQDFLNNFNDSSLNRKQRVDAIKRHIN